MSHDVFLSYNSSDRPAARLVKDILVARGLTVFIDERELAPGQNFIPGLEAALLGCKSVAILMGPSGLGKWQQIEKDLALDRKAKDPSLPVVPVLLPGKVDPPTGFLSLNTWVDLRQDLRDPGRIERLDSALRGKPGDEDGFRPRFEVCPYRGLEPFREEDRAFYFGRDQEVAKLVELVRTTGRKVVPVIGSSGSGKSSLVYAGLIPVLRDPRQGVPWEIKTLSPGAEPLEALVRELSPPNEDLTELQQAKSVEEDIAALRGSTKLSTVVRQVLHRSGGSERLLLFVDQWEELYTRLPREDGTPARRKVREAAVADRLIFIDALLEAAENSPCTVVFTVRADYYDALLGWDTRLRNGRLEDHLNLARFSVGQMRREALREAIEKPAALAGFTFQPGLVDTILNDLGREPGNLPLLEFLLAELWQYHARNQQTVFTLDGYVAVGRVSGAIAKRAEATLAKLVEDKGADAADAARRVFVSLVSPAEDAAKDTRAAIALPAGGLEADVVSQFSAARLLTAGKGKVEVAHEALIREWGTLRDEWLRENRDFLRLRDRIRDARDLWDPPEQERGDDEDGSADRPRAAGKRRSPDRLIQPGLPLVEARNLLRNHGDVDIDDIRDYIRRSLQRAFWMRVRNAAAALSLVVVPVLLYLFHLPIARFTEEVVILWREDQLTKQYHQPRPATAFPGEVPEVVRGRQLFTNSIGMDLLWVGPGTFEMGSPETEKDYSEDEILHEVILTRGFWMGRFEVTQQQYEAVAGENPSSRAGFPHDPVTDVSWEEALRFCETLTQRDRDSGGLPPGWSYTLPTEAQWEYACRAGTKSPFHFGGMLNGYLANCDGTIPYGIAMIGPSLERTSVVGVYPANRFGFHDMHGNVWEWCLDGYGDYDREQREDPFTDPRQASYRVYRGGSWNSIARYCRSASRDWRAPGYRSDDLGFRPVLILASQ